ncbi:MAG TPA: GAP family protein [Solirubrobacteraceae bacterium]|nr:GAP family protein [Solirubrobacteraceae bacterium]
MSALPEALPLALSASIYPPALLILLLLLTGEHPRRLVLAYFAGAAIMVVGAGLFALTVMKGSGATTQKSAAVGGGVYIVIGLALLALGAWLWRRRGREPDKPVESPEKGPGRIAQWSQRATDSQRWSFILGLAMFLPSPMYLLAINEIVNSGSSWTSDVTAVLICAAAVLLFVEVTVIALFIRPADVASGLHRASDWLSRNGWTLGAIIAFAAGAYALGKGIHTLS